MNEKLAIRKARRDDVPAIVAMLADDQLGKSRERFEEPIPTAYFDAFESIDEDSNNELVIAESDGRPVGVLQLTFIQYLTYQGGRRALIEGVRVASDSRAKGIGRELIEWAIERAREQDCHVVQLSTDKSRPDAIRFYEGLGFNASHEGMKLHF